MRMPVTQSQANHVAVPQSAWSGTLLAGSQAPAVSNSFCVFDVALDAVVVVAEKL
jgi:hypothetical protein